MQRAECVVRVRERDDSVHGLRDQPVDGLPHGLRRRLLENGDGQEVAGRPGRLLQTDKGLPGAVLVQVDREEPDGSG